MLLLSPEFCWFWLLVKIIKAKFICIKEASLPYQKIKTNSPISSLEACNTSFTGIKLYH